MYNWSGMDDRYMMSVDYWSCMQNWGCVDGMDHWSGVNDWSSVHSMDHWGRVDG